MSATDAPVQTITSARALISRARALANTLRHALRFRYPHYRRTAIALHALLLLQILALLTLLAFWLALQAQINNFVDAVYARDDAALESLIDYRKVRRALTLKLASYHVISGAMAQMQRAKEHQSLDARARKDAAQSPQEIKAFERVDSLLRRALAPQVAASKVDTYLSVNGLIDLMRGWLPDDIYGKFLDPAPPLSLRRSDLLDGSQLRFTPLRVYIEQPEKRGRTIRFGFSWSGGWRGGWRLVELDIPPPLPSSAAPLPRAGSVK